MKSGAKRKPVETKVDRPGLARILGCSTRTVSTLEVENVIVPSIRGKAGKASVYVLEEIVPKFIAYKLGGSKPADENSRGRRDRAQAEYTEMQIALKRGELLPADQVRAEGAAYVSRVMAKLRSIPSRAVQEGSIPPDSRVKVDALIEEAVLEMSGWVS